MNSFKPAFLISMYDENECVISSCIEINSIYPDADIYICQSDSGYDLDISDLKNVKWYKLPDLSEKIEKIKLPSNAICRNFSFLFTKCNEKKYDLIVALTGDTLIYDATSFKRRYEDMKLNNKIALVSRPLHQREHSSDGVLWSRFVDYQMWDFICCLFLVDGKFANESKVFTNIKITNEYTSEQCLGDELKEKIGSMEKISFLNIDNPTQCYSYCDGIKWHAKYGGPGR